MPSKRKYTSPILDNVTDIKKSQTLKLTQSAILTWRFRCSSRRNFSNSHLLFWNRRDHRCIWPNPRLSASCRNKNKDSFEKRNYLSQRYITTTASFQWPFLSRLQRICCPIFLCVRILAKREARGNCPQRHFLLHIDKDVVQTNQFAFINESYNEAWVSSKQVSWQLRRKKTCSVRVLKDKSFTYSSFESLLCIGTTKSSMFV